MVPTLPEEILALILEEFALQRHDNLGQRSGGGPHICLTTLSNACLASKTLYRIAWPILYRFWSNRRCTHLAQGLDPARFLQTICTKPERGLALRSLMIGGWRPVGTMDPTELFEQLQGDATLVDLFQWRAKTFWLGEDQISPVSPNELHTDDSLQSTLFRSLKMGLPEAHMAMLLLLSPKLKTLEITTTSHFETSPIAKLLDIAVSKDYQMTTPPDSVHDPEQEESDYAIAQMFGASWPAPALQKVHMFRDLAECTIRGQGIHPSGLKFFKNLISLPALRRLDLTGLRGGYDNAISDLEIGVTCTRLRNLTLESCQILTTEACSIIRCCPELLTLHMTWHDSIQDLSSERDQRLQFGSIADAIAEHTPKLTSLQLATPEWPYRYLSSQYPYTIGKSLQQLKHLKRLELDHYMIYGMQHPEELSLDPYGSQSDTVSRTLGQAIPRAVEVLFIEPSDFVDTADGDTEPAEEWQDWQIEDLQRFLQDRSFERMHMIMFSRGFETSKEHISAESVAEHGWDVIMGLEKDETYCKLRNKGRERTTST
jgi:hypothetical protein